MNAVGIHPRPFLPRKQGVREGGSKPQHAISLAPPGSQLGSLPPATSDRVGRCRFPRSTATYPAVRCRAWAKACAIASQAGLGWRSASNGNGREASSSVRHFAS
jgi:hypothetical protein